MKGLHLERLLVAGTTRVQFTLDSGSHVLTAERADVFAGLYPLILGWERPRSGKVALHGEDPFGSPLLRARLGALLPVEAQLPGSRTVKQHLELVEATRKSAGARAFQNPYLPLPTSLLDRPIGSLGASERRRLALHLAINTPQPLLLLLHDPLATVNAGEEEQLLAALDAVAQEGALLVFTTHESWSTSRLSQRIHSLEQKPTAPSQLGQRRWLLRLERPRDVAALLARSPLIDSTAVDPLRPDELRLVGRDDETLGATIQQAIVQSRSDVSELVDLGPLYPSPSEHS